jgi:hypothetical protein
VEEKKDEKKIEKARSPRKKLFSLEFDFFELNADEIFSRLGPYFYDNFITNITVKFILWNKSFQTDNQSNNSTNNS